MTQTIHDSIAQAERGENPKLICKMASGWLFLGDYQFFRGYCVLVADPIVASLNDLNAAARTTFLLDMSAVGDALLNVTEAWRINYAVLGNGLPVLHAHLHPRYESEPEALRRGPYSAYGDERFSVPFDLERDRELMAALRAELGRSGFSRS